MTEAEKGEIRMWYRQAKDKRMQIQILADMFLTSPQQIREIVGVESGKKAQAQNLRQQVSRGIGMVKGGKSWKEAAREVGLTESTLRRKTLEAAAQLMYDGESCEAACKAVGMKGKTVRAYRERKERQGI